MKQAMVFVMMLVCLNLGGCIGSRMPLINPGMTKAEFEAETSGNKETYRLQPIDVAMALEGKTGYIVTTYEILDREYRGQSFVRVSKDAKGNIVDVVYFAY